jgi:hypothetical protein
MSSFSFIHWAIVGVIFYVLFRAVKGLIGPSRDEKHCLDCGTEAKAQVHTPGNMAIEIILWICFIIPGVIYSIWRLGARKTVCPACQSPRLIPITSPAAVAHKQQLFGKIECR